MIGTQENFKKIKFIGIRTQYFIVIFKKNSTHLASRVLLHF